MLRSFLGPAPDGAAERQPTDVSSAYWGESAARYEFALQFVHADTVALDVACGTGYGLRLISGRGARPFGVDLDPEATHAAISQDPYRRSVVLRGNGCRLPFRDATFSLVTSFETIEHLHTRAELVVELRRVLRPNGVLVLSTPNALHTRPVNGKPDNPFHVHEYTPPELRQELSACFEDVQLLGQILDGRFRIPPYWLDQQRLPRTPGAQLGLLTRKVMNRLPQGVRDQMSQVLWGHSFFPRSRDYHFDAAGIERAANLVAVCR
jgi:SAM-dependent methyltransferase